MKPLAVLMLLGVATSAAAQEHFLASGRPLDFALYLSSTELPLHDGSSTADTEVKRVGINWRERHGQRLQLGLIGGASYLTQRNNAATAGRELDGYHAGFSFDVDLYTGTHVNLRFNTAYLYQRVEDDRAGQRVVISWREPSAHITAGAALGGGLWVYAGARYSGVDGEQRLSGIVNETRDVERDAKAGGIAELELRLEDNGYIRLTGMSGANRGVALHFGHSY